MSLVRSVLLIALSAALPACASLDERGDPRPPQITPPPDAETRAFRSRVLRLAVSLDERWLAVAGNFGDIRLYDARTLEFIRELGLTYSWDHHVRLVLTNERLYAASSAGPTRGWDLASGDRLFSVHIPLFARNLFQLTADGQTLLVGHGQQQVRALDARAGEDRTVDRSEIRTETHQYRIVGSFRAGRRVYRQNCAAPLLQLRPWRHGFWEFTETHDGDLYLADGSGRVLRWERESLPCPAK